jgi:uncharacterized delta-60 repeat protein
MRRNSWLLVIACFLISIRLIAQTPGAFDTNYVTLAGTDATPSFVVALAGGKTLTGGSFTNYGGSGRGGLVRLNGNGTVDTGFALPSPKLISPPVIFNGNVLSAGATNAGTIVGAVIRPDGRTVFFGNFTHLGADAHTNKIALANDDGSLAPFSPELALVSRASGLSGPGNSVYIGGGWNVVDAARPVIQRLNADGSNDPSFVGPTPDSLGYAAGSIRAIVRGPGDTIYIVVNSTTQEVIRLTATGALDATFADGGRAAGSFSTTQFASAPNGQLVLSGTGLFRGQARASSLTRLTLDGAVDTTFAPPAGITASGKVGVQADNKLVVLDAPGALASRYNENGSRDTGYANPGKVPASLPVVVAFDLAIGPDGSAYVAALFFNASFQQLQGIFHILGDPNTAPTIATQPLAQTNTLGARTRFSVAAQGAPPLEFRWFRGAALVPNANSPELILPTTTAADDADFHCVVSNGLGSAPSATVHLTLLEASAGSVYRETDVPAGPDDEVRDLVFDADGSLLASGRFALWNNTNRANIARLLPGTADLDSSFGSGTQPVFTSNDNQTLPLPGGKVLAVGFPGVNYNGRRHDGLLRMNANGSLDTTFNPDGVGGTLTYSGVNDNGALAALGADGKVVVSAQTWNGESVSSYIRLNENGTRDTSFALRGSSYFVTSTVIVALPDGRYLVAGTTNVNGAGASGVLRLNADGTVDPTFHTASPYTLGAGVNDILVQPDGRILVGGTFNVRNNPDGSQLVVGLARLLADGRPDPDFNGVPQLSQAAYFKAGDVRRLALQADGRIVAVARPLNGVFPAANLLRFWPSGALDPEFQVATNSTPNGNPILFAVAARSDNTLFLGGNFAQFSGFARRSFVRVNGGPLRSTPAAPTIESQPARVVAKSGSNVTLTIVPGGSGPFQFQWRRNAGPGSTNFADIIGATNASLALNGLRLLPTDSGLFQCGVVNPGGSVYSKVIPVLVEPDPALPGVLDTSFVSGVPMEAKEQQTAVNPDGSLFAVSGGFLKHLFEDGSQDVSLAARADLFVPGVGGVSVVRRQPDGKILVGGALKGGVLARLLPDGSYDPAFVLANGFTANARPSQIEMQSDGKILVCLPNGGQFRNAAGATVLSLARFLPDGTLDNTFQPLGLIATFPSGGPNPGTLGGLRVLADDRIYIGGGFTQVQGVARFGVARLSADGLLDATFAPPTDGLVAIGFGAMAFSDLGPVTPEGGLYIFGRFNAPTRAALRLRADGAIDPVFQLFTSDLIESGALQTDGKLIFSHSGVIERANADGTPDAAWKKGGAFNRDLTILPDGKLLAGSGRFFTGLGAFVPNPNLIFTRSPNGLGFTWPAGFKLQRATHLAPANWEDVPATSPFTVPTANASEYFRLISSN